MLELAHVTGVEQPVQDSRETGARGATKHNNGARRQLLSNGCFTFPQPLELARLRQRWQVPAVGAQGGAALVQSRAKVQRRPVLSSDKKTPLHHHVASWEPSLP